MIRALLIILVMSLLGTQAQAYDLRIAGDIPLAEPVSGIAVHPDADIAAVISRDAGRLILLDTKTNTILGSTALDIIPSAVAMDAKRNRIIVSAGDGTLQFLDAATLGSTGSLPLNFSVNAMAIDRESSLLYIGINSGLLVMDLETGSIVREVTIGVPVNGIAIDQNLNLLVLITENGRLLALDVDTLTLNVELGTSDCCYSAISINPSTHMAVASNTANNAVSIISLEQKAVVARLPLTEQPSAIAVDAKSNTAYIGRKDGIAILKLENPVPQITSLVPKSARSGDSGFRLSVTGEKFIGDSQTEFDGKDAPTYFRTNETLQADISSEYLTKPGNVPVNVSNPPPGGGLSNTLTFRIYNPAPVLEAISPEVIAAQSSFTLRATGINFFNGSVINLNGENLKTKFISSILLEAEVNTSHTQRIGQYPVVVINPNPGGFTSNAKQIAILDQNDPLLTAMPGQDVAEEKTKKDTGSLRGRVINTHLQPLEGVTVKIRNLVAETDADGYFRLDNVPAGKRHILIDGSTEKKKDGKYPTIPLNVDILADTVNEMPFQVYFHKQKDRNFKDINPEEDTVLTDPEVPGFEMRIPKGVNITGWDGNPNLKVSVRTVPTDRLPVKPLPENSFIRTVYMFYFDKMGGGVPDHPIPVRSRNDLGLLPGEKAILWYYDESPKEGEAPNDWAIAGTGTVTPDGQYIVADPGMGIPKFCCGATGWGGSSSDDDPPPPDCKGQGGDPVFMATGAFSHSKTDLIIPGIIPVLITRYYLSGDSGIGMFGRGTYFEYDWWMGTYQDMLLLIKPGGYQHRFYLQADGTYINTSDPAMRGAVAVKNADNTKILRLKGGWTYKFDARGNMMEMADRNGKQLAFERRSDFEGNYLTKIITAEGRSVSFTQTYTGVNFRTDEISDDTGRTVKYTYQTVDSYPRLTRVDYPDGGAIQYQYDDAGRMTGIIDERDVPEVINEYDTSNRVIRQTHADGGVFTINYTTAGGHITETSLTSPNGGVTTWRFYDDAGTYKDKYVTQKTTPDGTTRFNREPGSNLLLSVIDTMGRTTSYAYDAKGNVASITDNAGNTTTFTYEDIFNLVTSSTNALGHVTSMTYDTNGNMLSTTAPDGKTTTFTYNAIGKPLTVTDNLGHVSTMEYDTSGNRIRVTDPLGNISQMAYDSLGRVITMTDAKGKSTNYTYDQMGRIRTVTNAHGNVTNYVYTPKGKPDFILDAKNQLIRYDYDSRGRLKKMTDQMGKAETYTYDTSDRLTSVTDRKGQTTNYQYDLMNRMTRATYHDSSYTEYAYDSGGRLLAINDSVAGTITYTYTGTGCGSGCSSMPDKVASETTPLGTINYTYDAIGRRTSMTVAGQPTVNYGYDTGGRLNDIKTLINGLEKHFTFTYDGMGRRNSTALPNGVTTNYSYDNGSRLLNLEHTDSLNQVLESLSYAYDQNGNRTSMTRPTVNLPLRDGVSGAAYNDANQMLSFSPATGSGKTITYDDNGNMTSITNSCGTTTYTWDVRNRLVGANGFDPFCFPLTTVFNYDAFGRRISKTINGVTTQYLYDGLDIIQEKNASGTVTANFIRILNIDEPLARIKADGSVRYYQQDALGSGIALTDETGAIRTQYSYDPFGNVIITGEASDNPFQFTGRENDGTGLYYYRARYYSPELQRFISEDPIGLAGGINLYAYVYNNPVNYTDNFGLEVVCELSSFNKGWNPPLLTENGPREIPNHVECHWKCDCDKCDFTTTGSCCPFKSRNEADETQFWYRCWCPRPGGEPYSRDFFYWRSRREPDHAPEGPFPEVPRLPPPFPSK